jgi:anti-sigma regulatory factor (Ser/Thr protein kinase)
VIDLEPDPSSSARARRLVERELAGSCPPDIVETAMLLVSELVTNVVLHARTAMRLSVEIVSGRVRVEVRDASPVSPVSRHYDVEASTGRGLALVAGLADAWGTNEQPGGKIVWFELSGGKSRPGPTVTRA